MFSLRNVQLFKERRIFCEYVRNCQRMIDKTTRQTMLKKNLWQFPTSIFYPCLGIRCVSALCGMVTLKLLRLKSI